MNSFEMFRPKCISIILDIVGVRPAKDGKAAYQHVKSAVIEGLTSIDSDDMVYIYRVEGQLEMAKTLAESISIVNDWQYRNVNVPVAIEESIVLVSQYPHSYPGVFYITDNYKSIYDGLLKQYLVEEYNSDVFCKFFFYGIGKSYNQSLGVVGEGITNHYHFRHLNDYSDLSDYFSKDLNSVCQMEIV